MESYLIIVHIWFKKYFSDTIGIYQIIRKIHDVITYEV